MKIIVVYKSKTGFSKQYAEWIQAVLNCEIIPLEKLKSLKNYDLVIYGGGLMAGQINGLNKLKSYIDNQNLMIYATGVTSKDAVDVVNKMKEDNLAKIGRNVPFYYFEAGLDYDRLGFFAKKMLKIMHCSLQKKPNKTAEEIGMMKAISHSHNCAQQSDIQSLIETVKQSFY